MWFLWSQRPCLCETKSSNRTDNVWWVNEDTVMPYELFFKTICLLTDIRVVSDPLIAYPIRHDHAHHICLRLLRLCLNQSSSSIWCLYLRWIQLTSTNPLNWTWFTYVGVLRGHPFHDKITHRSSAALDYQMHVLQLITLIVNLQPWCHHPPSCNIANENS